MIFAGCHLLLSCLYPSTCGKTSVWLGDHCRQGPPHPCFRPIRMDLHLRVQSDRSTGNAGAFQSLVCHFYVIMPAEVIFRPAWEFIPKRTITKMHTHEKSARACQWCMQSTVALLHVGHVYKPRSPAERILWVRHASLILIIGVNDIIDTKLLLWVGGGSEWIFCTF